MAYSTQADILLRLSSATLGQLTDDTGAGAVQAATVTRAIADADAVIDSYIRGKNTTGNTDVAVRLYSVNLAIYNLYTRRNPDIIPEGITAGREDAMAWLKAVRDNKVLIDDSTSAANTSSFIQVNKTSSNKVFTSTVLDTYR
jgi:phage gp36-like protein